MVKHTPTPPSALLGKKCLSVDAMYCNAYIYIYIDKGPVENSLKK